MDHVWNSLQPHYQVEAEWFLKEWKTGKYQKWSDCPSYGSLRVIIKAANIIRKYLGWDRLSVRDIVENGIW